MNRILQCLTLLLIVNSAAVAQEANEAAPDDGQVPVDQRDSASENIQGNWPLEDLGWMIGRWIDRGDSVTITTDCRWTHGGRFLSRAFEITEAGEATLKGTQIIGWDPIEGQIRSWTFDSAGGFGSGRWFRDGNRWLVKTSFVLATGERASAINVITFVDQDTFRWQSTNREIAGELQPSISEVTVVRISEDDKTSPANSKGESK